jgi:hypothetical protein
MNKIMLAAALSVFSFPVHAYPTIEGKFSTIGIGVEVAFLMTKSVDMHILDARIGLNPFKYSLSKTAASNWITSNYSGKLNLVSLDSLADWHREHSIRLSGLVYGNNNLTMIVQPGLGTFGFGGAPSTAVSRQSENATIDFNKVVSNFGIGRGRTPKNSGLSFTNDIGIMFQGSPKTIVTTNFAGVAAADINQTNTDLNNSLNNFKIYPFVSIDVGYMF